MAPDISPTAEDSAEKILAQPARRGRPRIHPEGSISAWVTVHPDLAAKMGIKTPAELRAKITELFAKENGRGQ